MIPRYSRPEMAAIWTPETKFQIWFEIEAHACDAQAALGVIPEAAAKAVRERGRFDIERIDEIERETRHDVIAFLTNLAEHVGPEARFVHQGMTSSDVLDTCLAVQLARAADILIADIDALMAALKRRAFEHKDTLCVGRSHGVHAEPTTFGLKLAQAYAEFDRNRRRLAAAREEIAASCVTGAVMPQGVDDEQLRGRLRDRYGVMISGGYGELAGKLFRLGHMGMAAHPTYLCAQLAMLERTLADLGVPVTLGEGVGAALASLADWGERGETL